MPTYVHLHAGYAFYESQADGIGVYFQDSLFADIDSLRLFAGIHTQHHGFHRMLAHRFPYAIYYQVRRDKAWVYAVLDCRRDPRHTAKRLAKSNAG